jgi:hypothetical protein
MSAADPSKSALVSNRWLAGQRVHQRVMSGIRQALIYPGCGAKIGYSPGTGSAVDRVWMRIIPWWEIVLDSDVTDPEDERFRGHVFFQVKSKVEKEYGLGRLQGTRRDDFLDRLGQGGGTGKPAKGASTRTGGRQAKASTDSEAFVRVLEIINLVDTIQDKDDPSIEYQGRIEIYVLDQPGDLSKKPVYMGPLPFAKFDRTPLPHIVPLIFNHEPEYPFRGIPHSARLLPQMQELNKYRAFMAMATKKDVRQWYTRKGTFSGDTLTKVAEGVEGYIAELEADHSRPLDDQILPFPQTTLNTSIDKYMSYVELDLDRVMRQSPQARGEVTKATAFEVQTVQQYTESEFGMHAALKDQWLAEVVRLFLRALIAAMQSTGDYAGAFQKQEVELASVGAKPEEKIGSETVEAEENEQQAKAHVLSELQSFQAPFIDETAAPPLGAHDVSQQEVEIVQETLKLRDQRGDLVEIAVKDLDAEFDISFVEGGRTPLTDAAMQQNLVALLKPYSELWAASQQPGPMAVFAKTMMQVMAERFELPKDLYPEAMEARLKEEPQAPPPEPGADGKPAGGPPQGGGVAPEMREVLEGVLTVPPAEAIQVLKSLFAKSPEMMDMLTQIEALPPDQQAQMIEQMVTGLLEAEGPPAPANGKAPSPQSAPLAPPPTLQEQ